MTAILPKITEAAAYLRISVHDAKVPKTADQLLSLRKLAAQRGLNIREDCIFEDDGITASKDKIHRPGFEHLLMAVLEGKVGVVLATEEERFARNVTDKDRLQKACVLSGTTWITLRDGEVDPATSSGEFLSGLKAVVGRFESARKSERQTEAALLRREKGLPYSNGSVPFGWNEDRLTLNVAEADLIREGTAAVLKGKSLHQIVLTWRASGVKPPRAKAWGRVSVLMALRRWRNAGVVSYKDVPAPTKTNSEAKGTWQSIVSREDLENIRAILATTPGAKKRTANRLLSGIARCHCGEYLLGSGSNGTPAYMCSARIRGLAKPNMVHAGVKASLLDEAVEHEVITDLMWAPRNTHPSAAADGEELTTLHVRLAEVRKGFADLAELAGNKSFKVVAAHLATEEAELEHKIEQFASRSAHAAMLVETRNLMVLTSFDDTAAHAAKLAERFASLDLTQRRTLVRTSVNVMVYPHRDEHGRIDPERIVIEHLGAPVLNAPGQGWSSDEESV